ncbi:MAG: TrmB family transcriptional regulator [Candidatus Eisenbacteria sp.]|nr:TrmB family transcriptional regulator [Candidatus Eisenbacteria bacterium]
MTEATLLENLAKLGLNAYEARGYLALMERKSLTATQISTVSGIPRTRVYSVTESLMKKGLCSFIPGKIRKYRASEIDVAVDNLLRRNEESFEERRQRVLKAAAHLKDQLSGVYGDRSEDIDPLEYIEIIKEPHLIRKRFMQLVEEAKEEVLVFSKGPYSGPREGMAEQLEQEKDILKTGVRGRCIYEIPKDEDERRWFFRGIEQAVKAGEEARVIKELPMKMAIIDERTVILALEDPVSRQPSLTSQIVEHRALARGLKVLFETFWQDADVHPAVG